MNAIKWEIFRDEINLWRYRLKASNGRIMFISADNYASVKDAMQAIKAAQNLITMYDDAPIVEMVPPAS